MIEQFLKNEFKQGTYILFDKNSDIIIGTLFYSGYTTECEVNLISPYATLARMGFDINGVNDLKRELDFYPLSENVYLGLIEA